MAASYSQRAAKAFLSGLPYSSPAAAIEAGARTLTEWCATLDQARADAGIRSENVPQRVKPVELDDLAGEVAT